MLQRMLADGAASGSGRFSADRMLAVGDDPSRPGERWVSVGEKEGASALIKEWLEDNPNKQEESEAGDE